MRGLTLFFGMFFLVAIRFSAVAQDKSTVQFGKITPQDFLLPPGTDTTHGAVIIADIGQGSFEGTTQGGFSLVFTRFRRLKITDKTGFEAATDEIRLFTSGYGKEKVIELKGFTYNLENGLVVQTKLSGETTFEDKINKNILKKKFTMPATKAGSIVEYQYTTSTDFLRVLQPWVFQGPYPCLWSEYRVGFPEFLNYVVLAHGYLKFDINDRTSKRKSYIVQIKSDGFGSKALRISATEFSNHWAIKNVPAMKEEKFTSTVDNYRSQLSFQLSEFREPYEPDKVLTDWSTTSALLMKNKYFGSDLLDENSWLEDKMKVICDGALNPMQNASKIFAYVRDNIKCSDHGARETDKSLKAVFDSKIGNVAEVNLLLVAMLKYNGIVAKPVLLSTRNNGFTHITYPILSLFNYVICQAVIDKKIYYLDASHPNLGFNKLSPDCYNGHARIVDSELPMPVFFYADSLMERSTTTVFVSQDEKQPGKLSGEFDAQLGYYESLALRDEFKIRGRETFFQRVKNAYGSDADIRDIAIDTTKALEEPISMRYHFAFDGLGAETVYINPMMTEGISENYFKSAERVYPVEMPYASDKIYTFNFEIPKGYKLEEIPKSARVSLNESDGFFEYLIDTDEDVVRLRSRIKINKATFPPEDYQSLRDFFGFVVKKHAEQIVLKKK